MTRRGALMSTYNGGRFLKTQIDSVLSQQGVDVHLVIRDDGSSDETLTILEEYSDSVTIIKGQNCGCSNSFFELLRYAQSNFDDTCYFAFSDQDDFWLPDKLITAVNKLGDDNATPQLYISNLWIVDGNLDNRTLLYTKDVPLSKSHSLIENHATGCTMVFNKCVVDSILTTDTDKYRIHDLPIFILCLFKGKVIYDSVPHILYRQHHNNVIGANFYLRQRLRSKLRSLTCFWKQHVKENDARLWLEEFSDMFSTEDLKLIEEVAFYRVKFRYRMRLLFSRHYHMYRKKDDFWFKIRVLLGSV